MNAENNAEGGGGEGECWWSVVAGERRNVRSPAGNLMSSSPDGFVLW
jgi:hypothetical protein